MGHRCRDRRANRVERGGRHRRPPGQSGHRIVRRTGADRIPSGTQRHLASPCRCPAWPPPTAPASRPSRRPTAPSPANRPSTTSASAASSQETPADNFWMERAQATALATGDVSAFSTSVNWASLSAHLETAEPLITRLLQPLVRLVARARQGRDPRRPEQPGRRPAPELPRPGSALRRVRAHHVPARRRRRRPRSRGYSIRSASTTTSTAP